MCITTYLSSSKSELYGPHRYTSVWFVGDKASFSCAQLIRYLITDFDFDHLI